MRKFLKIVLVLIIVISTFSFFACSDKNNDSDEDIPEISFTITASKSRVKINESVEFTINSDVELNDVIWSVDDLTILSINSRTGEGKGISIGQTKVNATCGGVTASCDIEVYTEDVVKTELSFELNFPALSLYPSQKSVLDVTCLEDGKEIDATIEFAVKDQGIVSINNGEVTALNIGDTSITVIASAKGIEKKWIVPVSVQDNIIISFSDVIDNIVSTDYIEQDNILPKDATATSGKIEVEIFKNSEKISSPVYTLESLTPNVLTISGNDFSVVSAGQGSVVCKFNDSGKEYTAIKFFNIEYSEYDTANFNHEDMYIDLHTEEENCVKITLPDCVNEGIRNIQNQNGENIGFTALSNNTYSVEINNLLKGKTTYNFFGRLFDYKVEIYTADRVIASTKDFKDMLDDEMVFYDGTQNTDFIEKKLFVLKNDIGIEDTKLGTSQIYNGWLVGSTKDKDGNIIPGTLTFDNREDISFVNGNIMVFVHHFDGNGHVLSATKGDYFWTAGIFGVVKGGIVENLIVKDALIRDNGTARGGVIAQIAQEGAVIQNCVVINPFVAEGGGNVSFGMLAGNVYTNNTVIKNNLVIDQSTDSNIPNATAQSFYDGAKYKTTYYKLPSGYTFDENDENIAYYTTKNQKGEVEDVLDKNGNKIKKIYSQLCGLFGGLGDSALKADVYDNYCISIHDYYTAPNPNILSEERMEGKTVSNVSDFISAVGKNIKNYKLLKFENNCLFIGDAYTLFMIEENIETWPEGWN